MVFKNILAYNDKAICYVIYGLQTWQQGCTSFDKEYEKEDDADEILSLSIVDLDNFNARLCLHTSGTLKHLMNLRPVYSKTGNSLMFWDLLQY